jgi:TolB-like protein/Tfp pilus assembly protein PilF
MSSFINELKRRNVVRVSVAYIVASWLLIQAAGVLEPALLLPEWVDRVVTVFLMIGFPIVIIFAWAFELTPDGVKLTRDVDQGSSITQTTGKKLEYFTIAGLSLVVVFFLAKEFLISEPQPQTEEVVAVEEPMPTSIAVLPFEDFSEKADQGYFSRGISEEILNLLAKTRGLRVAARTSSFAFAGTEIDIREIGEKLSVDTVLEGSIRKSGDTIRITAQLINIEDGYHLWSETYDRDYVDIFKIQDEIAASILTSLKVHLLGEQDQQVASEQTINLDAYSTYLIGKERMSLRKKEDIETARAKFEKAIEIDPDYAPARVALAHSWLLLEREEFGKADKAQVDAVVGPQLTAALELSPDSAEAIALRGLHHFNRYRYEDALRDFDHAIKLNNNYALAYLWRSQVYYEKEQFLDMLADKEKAYALDPMSLDISSELAYDYGAFWRPRDADRIIERMFDLHPDHPRAYMALAANLSSHGRNAELALMLEEALQKHPDNKNFKRYYAESLLNIGLFDQAAALNDAHANFLIYLDQGRLEKARELVDNWLSEDEGHGLEHAVEYQLRLKSEMGLRPLKTAVMNQIAWQDENNIPWREECRPYALLALREAGVNDGVDSILENCRKNIDERLKAKYLCPCSWFGLVLVATLDDRVDDAIMRADEWLTRGDSYSLLHRDPIIKILSDRPEYAEILERNDEQVDRQKQIYLAGVAARDAEKAQGSPAEVASAGTSGF